MRREASYAHAARFVACACLAATLVMYGGCASSRESHHHELPSPEITSDRRAESTCVPSDAKLASANEHGALPPTPLKRPFSLTESVEYTDGGARHTAWISKELVAEFTPTPEGARMVLGLAPSAEEVPTYLRGARVWKIKGKSPEELANELARQGFAVSPVFHPNPTPSPQLSALPGGVFAKFPPSWDGPRVASWLSTQQLSAGSQLAGSPNVYAIPCEPGMKVIELVRKLEGSGVLLECTPNWMRSASLR